MNNSELRDANIERTVLIAGITPCLDRVALEGAGVEHPHSLEAYLAQENAAVREKERALGILGQSDVTLAS